MPYYGPRKYTPLTTYLASLAADEVTLTFAEIEAIIGTTLPSSVSRASFWANTATSWGSSSQSTAWRRAGWRVAGTNVGGGTVTFARVQPS